MDRERTRRCRNRQDGTPCPTKRLELPFPPLVGIMVRPETKTGARDLSPANVEASNITMEVPTAHLVSWDRCSLVPDHTRPAFFTDGGTVTTHTRPTARVSQCWNSSVPTTSACSDSSSNGPRGASSIIRRLFTRTQDDVKLRGSGIPLDCCKEHLSRWTRSEHYTKQRFVSTVLESEPESGSRKVR
jgi:hypothetical protein